MLVVKDPNAFALRYGAGLPVAGQYAGSLDNNGERTAPRGCFRREDPRFQPTINTWYPITDGHGYSLVIVDDSQPWSAWELKESWRPNGTLGGTPAATDPWLPSPGSVVINEILAHTDPPLSDAIELLNPAATNLNIGNWFLTDDFKVPRKYRIPDPTILGPGGYVCFTETHFNSTGSLTSFVLNSEGDDVWLFSADASGKLTGYVQGFDFGATANGVSLGRYTNSVGQVDYPAQKELTLGRANAGPLIGPVVISEIMYHAPAAGTNLPASYIELASIVSTNVPLYYPTEPTNTWRLRNGVDFDFPQNVQMPAQGRLLVVGFDPSTNTVTVNAFRALYGVDSNVPIFGPWQGRLGNSGETLELKKPDAWGTNGVPYILVDKVSYADTNPWPAIADGAGASLQRLGLSGYGDDPGNWFASNPTPGAPNVLANHLAISPSPKGCVLIFQGMPGTICELQRSADFASWTTLVQQPVPLDGVVRYEDQTYPGAAAYYRALSRQQ